MDEYGERIRHLETRLRQLQLALVAVLGLPLFLFAVAAAARQAPSVLRVRGIIIEDAEGRERILLGSPFPKVPGRKRQDQETSAIVFLNERGADRLTLGEGTLPQVGGRVVHRSPGLISNYGMLIHDANGDERGGMTFFADSAGGGRAVVALDRPTGDAWAAWVDDKSGWAGMVLNYPMPLGKYQPAVQMGFRQDAPFLHIRDKDNHTRVELSLKADGSPAFTSFDAKGSQLGDLLLPAKR